MKMINIILLTLVFCINLFAQDAQQKFEQANQYYTDGQYSSAIDQYEKLLADGYKTPEIYFNLGNSYFKLNDIAYSILYYEKAKKLAPGDEEIDYNLRIANLQTVDKIEPVPEFFLNQFWNDIVLFTKPCNWTWAFIILLWLSIVSFAFFYLSNSSLLKKLFFALGGFGLLLSIFVLVISIQSENIQNAENTAVIFEPSIYVKASPDEQSTDLFILHEGTKVEILDEVGEWREIKIADGNTGWLPADSFQVI